MAKKSTVLWFTPTGEPPEELNPRNIPTVQEVEASKALQEADLIAGEKMALEEMDEAEREEYLVQKRQRQAGIAQLNQCASCGAVFKQWRSKCPNCGAVLE